MNLTSTSFKRNSIYKNIKKHKMLFIMLIIPMIYYIIFRYIPMYGAQIAFKNYHLLKGITGSEWIGLENFRIMFSYKSFKEVFTNTIVISFLKLIFGYPAPIIFAIVLNEVLHLRLKKVVQTITYIPHFVSWVVLAGLFTIFLSPSMGPINMLIKAFGGRPIFFLADPKWFRGVLVFTSVWKGFGWGSIIYIAVISSIDPALFEAAEIDGANRIRKIIHITLPSLIPVIMITFILAVGRLINDDFDQIFNLYNEAVYKVADVISTYTYRRGLVNTEYSFAAAVGLFKNVLGLILLIITNSIAKKFNDYGIW